MKYAIVDDEEMSRKLLQAMCDKIPGLIPAGVGTNAIEGMNILQQNEVDLLFLDVEMPDLTGIQLLRSLPIIPQVILTTSKVEYALEAFECKVTDYLHKPISFPRFIQAVERARENYSSEGQRDRNDIYVKVDGRYIRISLENILYIESYGDYVIIHTEKRDRFIVHSTLKAIEEKLTNTSFLKVHRSFIVNLQKVVDIEETNLVIRDKVIPVSRAQRPVLMNLIKVL